MGPPALVDTNLLIDYSVGVPAAGRELSKYQDRAISVISRVEFLAVEEGEGLERAEAFLTQFLQIELTPAIVEEAIRIRRSKRLKLPDAVLLATAHVEKRLLLTRNTKDFKPDKWVRIPYTL